MRIYRGTTPTFKWKITDKNFDLEEIKEIWMTFKTAKSESSIFTKKKNDLEIDLDEKTISYQLTQEETLSFKFPMIEVQLRILMNDGLSYANDIQTIDVGRILKGGVIQ